MEICDQEGIFNKVKGSNNFETPFESVGCWAAEQTCMGVTRGGITNK